jgi:hypothetical protein
MQFPQFWRSLATLFVLAAAADLDVTTALVMLADALAVGKVLQDASKFRIYKVTRVQYIL